MTVNDGVLVKLMVVINPSGKNSGVSFRNDKRRGLKARRRRPNDASL